MNATPLRPERADDPLDPSRHADDQVVDTALRPPTLGEFRGQPRVAEQLGLVLAAAQQRGVVPDHVLLSAAPVGAGTVLLARASHAAFYVCLVTIGMALPPRTCSSAVMMALTPASMMRSCTLLALKPPKTTECVAPRRAQACMAITPCTLMGI